jgi:hypothetical protein
MNPIIRISILALWLGPFLSAPAAAANVPEILAVQERARGELASLARTLEKEIREGKAEALTRRFTVSREVRAGLDRWLGEVSRHGEIASVVVDLPILGATPESILVFNARFDVVFAGGAADQPYRFGCPPLVAVKREGSWALTEASLEEVPDLPPVSISRAEFEVVPETTSSSVEVEARFTVTNEHRDPLDRFPLHLRYPMAWRSLLLDGEPARGEIVLGHVQKQPVAQLVLAPNEPLRPGKTAELTFRYSLSFVHHHLGRKPVGFTPDRGFVLFETGWYPRAARDWTTFPFTLAITVPRGIRGLSAGECLKHETEGERERYVYRTELDEMPYFVWGAYREETVTLGDVRLDVWVPARGGVDPARLVEVGREIFALYREILPPPAIDRFRIVAVTRFGGYGPPRNLLVNDSYFQEDEVRKPETLDFLAHELSHSWVNSLAMPIGDPYLMLSEGLATYLGAKSVERLRGKEAAAGIWQRNCENYQEVATRAVPPVRLCERLQFEDNRMFRGVAYFKGAYLFRELESWLGEKMIFDALRRVLSSRRGESFTLDDFLASVSEVSKTSLADFRHSFLE